jgi:hypothetical protein
VVVKNVTFFQRKVVWKCSFRGWAMAPHWNCCFRQSVAEPVSTPIKVRSVHFEPPTSDSADLQRSSHFRFQVNIKHCSRKNNLVYLPDSNFLKIISVSTKTASISSKFNELFSCQTVWYGRNSVRIALDVVKRLWNDFFLWNDFTVSPL